MTIDNFFTWEMLATFAGCVAATGIVTELLKKFIKKLDPQIISFVIAMIILVVGQLVAKIFTWNDLLLDAINAVVVSFAANGGFDALKRLFNKDENVGELILNGTDSYISFSDSPDKLKDGDKVEMTVKQVDA